MKDNEINEMLYGRTMGKTAQTLYKFSSRGVMWPAIYGAVFGSALFPFPTFFSAAIGVIIAYLLIAPVIGAFSPFSYTAMLVIAAIGAYSQGDTFWMLIALILLVIHLFRTIIMFAMVRRYPRQTKALDTQYQNFQ